MITYLIIGLLVQIGILALRLVLGKTQEYFKYLVEELGTPKGKDLLLFICGILYGMALNILAWPIAIISEIYNTINEI